jgi:hypothetical protein
MDIFVSAPLFQSTAEHIAACRETRELARCARHLLAVARAETVELRILIRHNIQRLRAFDERAFISKTDQSS